MDTPLEPVNGYDVKLNTKTLFLLSTSGSQSSIEKHNKALKTLGINLVYFTFAHEILPQTYANLFRAPIVRGGAVTGKGLKAGILPYLDELDELSKSIGAVNTVLNINGKLHGYNTDAFGLETAFHQQFALSGNDVKKAVIYGNGGVSGVAAYVLKKMGVAVTMKGRNPEKVAEKMKSLGLENFDGPYDLAVSATPVSSEPLENAIGLLDILNESKMVFDHNMPEKDNKKNHIEEYCKTAGKYFIPGKEMYVPQMIKQWKLFLDGVNNGETPISISEEEIIKAWELKV